MIYRPLMLLAVGAGVVFPLLILISQGLFLQSGIFLSSVFFLLIFRRLDLWWSFSVATANSGLMLLTPNASLHLIGMLGFAALGIMTFIMSQGRGEVEVSVIRRAAILLLIVVIATAFLRGWGLRILGSAKWGGMQYIQVIAALIFYIYSARITLPKVVVWRTVRLFCLMGLAPAVVLLILQFVPFVNFLLMFVHLSGAGGDVPEIARGGRLALLEFPAIYAGLFALLLFERRLLFGPVVFLFAMLCFVMLGLSGHRTVVVLLGFFVFAYLLIRRKSLSVNIVIYLILFISVVIVVVYLFVDYLPISFQRAFAFLPGIRVAYEASITAEATTTWRVEMWRMMIPMIPDYIFLGRGLGYDLAEAYAAYTLTSDLNQQLFFIATHNYHNGPLWLIVDLGLAGFIACSILLVGGVVRYYRVLKKIPSQSTWFSIYVVFYSFMVASVIFFYVIIGGHSGLVRLLVLFSILEVIASSFHAECREKRQSEIQTVDEPAVRKKGYINAQLPDYRVHPVWAGYRGGSVG